jgi:hypothetical protein
MLWMVAVMLLVFGGLGFGPLSAFLGGVAWLFIVAALVIMTVQLGAGQRTT